MKSPPIAYLAGLLICALARRSHGQSLELQPCRVAGLPVVLRCGTLTVYEDRAHPHAGARRLSLAVRVIPSSATSPAPDPLVFVSPGGPGTTNSDDVFYAYARGWRSDRDVVMVDLRGTSDPGRLDCVTPGSADEPLRYLESEFDTAVVARCRLQLAAHADLRKYTTANAMDDLYDALLALGYHQVDLWGASGGTREALEFLRRHPRMVRAAILEGTAPVSIKNPLTHAAAAQQALDSLFAQCARDVPCHEGFPRLPNEFARLEQLALRRPLRAHVPSGIGARDSIVELTWPMIAEIVRELSYSAPSERTIPFLVHRASLGDYAPLISAGIRSSRGLRQGIRLGFLLSQTCLEDVPRITDAEIVRETAHTYLGDVRVREQRAACRQWIGITPAVGNSTPVRSDIPVFLLSGTIDPVTPAHFAADAARYLSHSVHVIAPGGHVPTGPCVESMERQFLAAPAAPVDTSCVRTMTLPPFRIR